MRAAYIFSLFLLQRRRRLNVNLIELVLIHIFIFLVHRWGPVPDRRFRVNFCGWIWMNSSGLRFSPPSFLRFVTGLFLSMVTVPRGFSMPSGVQPAFCRDSFSSQREGLKSCKQRLAKFTCSGKTRIIFQSQTRSWQSNVVDKVTYWIFAPHTLWPGLNTLSTCFGICRNACIAVWVQNTYTTTLEDKI